MRVTGVKVIACRFTLNLSTMKSLAIAYENNNSEQVKKDQQIVKGQMLKKILFYI